MPEWSRDPEHPAPCSLVCEAAPHPTGAAPSNPTPVLPAVPFLPDQPWIRVPGDPLLKGTREGQRLIIPAAFLQASRGFSSWELAGHPHMLTW